MGGQWPNKRATLITCLLKKGELKSSPLLDLKKGKMQPAREKAPGIKKSFSNYYAILTELVSGLSKV
jgi:hypothetical protein